MHGQQNIYLFYIYFYMVLYLLDCYVCGDYMQLFYDWNRKQYEDERMKKRIKAFSGLLLVSDIYKYIGCSLRGATQAINWFGRVHFHSEVHGVVIQNPIYVTE